ncbi:MAG: DUF481 domain-containing protein [Planctomycetota bacterium]
MRWIALILLLAGCASSSLSPEPEVVWGDVFAPEPKLEFDPAFDWIQLTSGEWLKGEITELRDRSLEFDSDEMDDQTFDWEDVKEVRSRDMVTATFEDPEDPRHPIVVTGKLYAVGDSIQLGSRKFEREDLISIIPGEATEADYWSGKISFNATMRSGNTDQVDAGLYGRLLRRSPYSRLDFVYRGNYGEVEDVEVVNNHLFTGTWDLFISRDFYVTPFKLEIYSDEFQNIRYRVTPSAGVGYHVIDEPGMEWDVMAGLGWQFTKYDTVEPGEDRYTDQGIATVGSHYEWDITADSDLTIDYSAQIGLSDIDDSTQHLGIILSSDLYGDLELDVGFYWDWVGDPVPDEDGNTPEKSDFRITVGVGWDF